MVEKTKRFGEGGHLQFRYVDDSVNDVKWAEITILNFMNEYNFSEVHFESGSVNANATQLIGDDPNELRELAAFISDIADEIEGEEVE